MTAHILFKNMIVKCATIQKIIKDFIRKINYRGIIISDDISMKSLKYGIVENALKALKAGCNCLIL